MHLGHDGSLGVDQGALSSIDIDIRHKMEAPGAPPIIGLFDVENRNAALESLAEYLSGSPDKLASAFRNYPYATCWSVAAILRHKYNNAEEDYGPNAVYPPLEKALRISFAVNGSARNALREGFDSLHRYMGISQSDYRPVSIYLAQAGFAESMLEHLAMAFLQQERHFGLPSGSSSQELNRWQEDALDFLPKHIRSPLYAIKIDETGWHAALYAKIKRGGEISSERRFDAAFQAAIQAQASNVSGRDAVISTPPHPRLCWNDNSLGLYVHRLEGRLKFWSKPDEQSSRLRLRGGGVCQLAEPWPMEMRWESEGHGGDISFLRNPRAIAIFDRQSGRLVCEVDPQRKLEPLDVVEAVMLCRQSFSVDGEDSHMLSRQAYAASCILETRLKHVVVNGESFSLELRPRRRITAMGDVVARSGQKILYGSDVQFRIETGQGTAERRNLRIITASQTTVSIPLNFDDTGVLFITLPEILAALNITDPSSLSDPIRLRMELPGSGEGNVGYPFLAEFMVWPGVAIDDGGFLLKTPASPTNLSFENCRHIQLDQRGQICLDRDGGYDKACLAFEIDKVIQRFYLPFPDVTCLRNTRDGQRRLLPLRSQLILREDERFDAITIRCPDPKADLIVRGKTEKAPFFMGAHRNIPLLQLMQTSENDRVLIRKGSGADIELFRVVESLEPKIFLPRKLLQDEWQLILETPEAIDAFQLTLEDELGGVIRAEVALNHRPVDELPAKWLTGNMPNKNLQQVRMQILLSELPEDLPKGLHLARILVRPEGQEIWKRLGNQHGDIYAFLIDTGKMRCSHSSDKKRFQTLSRWLTRCYALRAWEHIGDRMYQRWQELGEQLFFTPEGRNTVLAEAMPDAPEDASPSWVPMIHPLLFLPEMYGVTWQHFESLAVCENEDVAVLSVVAEVSSEGLRENSALHDVVFSAFANFREADATGEPLRDFDPKCFLRNIKYDYIDDDPAAGWFWPGKPFLGPGHWRAAHIRFDERIETVGLFGDQNPNERTPNAARKISLQRLMNMCFRQEELRPPVPKIPDKELDEVGRWVATTLCVFAREARAGNVADWADRVSQALGCRRESVLQDVAFLLRLAPELFAFYMGMWQLKRREPTKFPQQ